MRVAAEFRRQLFGTGQCVPPQELGQSCPLVFPPTDEYQRGIALTKKGRFAEAVAAYRQAIALNPDSQPAYHELGEQYGPHTLSKPAGEIDEMLRIAGRGQHTMSGFESFFGEGSAKAAGSSRN